MALTVTVKINGQLTTLTYNSSTGKYEGTITAPSQTSGSNNSGNGPGVGSAAAGKGYYPVEVAATDDYGNKTTKTDSDATLGASLRLKVLEKVLPTAQVTYPTNGSTITNSTPAITFKFTDAGSGIKDSECYIKIDAGSWTKVTVTGTGTDRTGTYTPPTALADGSHTIQVKTTDYDGNSKTSDAISFKIDTIPPTLVVTSPTNGSKQNFLKIDLVGNTSDETSSPVTITATLNGTSVGAITIGENGTFSKEITGVVGTNTIKVTATDSAGKFTEQTIVVNINMTPPTISAVSVTPNPAETGKTVTIAVTVTDD